MASQYAAAQNCTKEIASEYLTIARRNRNRVPFYAIMLDEDGEETSEDMSCDNDWNYTIILRDRAFARIVQDAFHQLSYKETMLVKGRAPFVGIVVISDCCRNDFPLRIGNRVQIQYHQRSGTSLQTGSEKADMLFDRYGRIGHCGIKADIHAQEDSS